MNNKLEIQICTAQDIDEISRVAIKSYKQFYLYLWNDDGDWYVNRSFLPEVIAQEMEDANARFYLLKSGTDTIGFMKLLVDQSLDEARIRNAMELERIYITKEFLGKGFGRIAIEFCLNLANNMDKEMLWLKSMDSSPAIAFYQRLGFEICGSATLDYEMMKPEFRGMKILMRRL